jgi:hypothetical protein
MRSQYVLMRRRDRLVRQISDNLDFLIGSVSTKGLQYEAYNLTTKVDGVTKTKNWLLVRQGVDLQDYGTE